MPDDQDQDPAPPAKRPVKPTPPTPEAAARTRRLMWWVFGGGLVVMILVVALTNPRGFFGNSSPAAIGLQLSIIALCIASIVRLRGRRPRQ